MAGQTFLSEHFSQVFFPTKVIPTEFLIVKDNKNMGLIEFSKLPVNTLVGADWKTFKTVTKCQHIASDKKTKFYLTKAICRLLSVCVPL